MLKISPVTFTSNENQRRISQEQREDIRDTAVAGGAAGAGYTAAKSGGLNMAKKIKEASSTTSQTTGSLKRSLSNIKEGKQAITKTAVEAKGLFGNFRKNAKIFTDNMLNTLKNMKVGKFVQRIINTPVVKFGCGVAGGILAVCVLLSGMGTLYSNTTKVVNNYVPKIADDINDFSEKYKSMNSSKNEE